MQWQTLGERCDKPNMTCWLHKVRYHVPWVGQCQVWCHYRMLLYRSPALTSETNDATLPLCTSSKPHCPSSMRQVIVNVQNVCIKTLVVAGGGNVMYKRNQPKTYHMYQFLILMYNSIYHDADTISSSSRSVSWICWLSSKTSSSNINFTGISPILFSVR